jgi:hypothetical protein
LSDSHYVARLSPDPFKSGEETLPEGVKPGVDVLWQGHLLSLEPLRHIGFMRNDNKDMSFWRSVKGRELARRLEQCGGRMHGKLLLPHHFAVSKNKSMLLRNPQSDKAGTKLVDALDKLSSRLSTWSQLADKANVFSDCLDKWHTFDEEVRFVFEGGDVERYFVPVPNDAPQNDPRRTNPEQRGFFTKKLRYCTEEFDAPTSAHGVEARAQPLHVKLVSALRHECMIASPLEICQTLPLKSSACVCVCVCVCTDA